MRMKILMPYIVILLFYVPMCLQANNSVSVPPSPSPSLPQTQSAAGATVPQQIKVLGDNQQQDSSINYFRALLIKALDATVEDFGPYEITHVSFAFSQSRTLQMLKVPEALDVMHTMSSQARESEFLPVRIPLLKGLMGTRMMFVHRSKVEEFNNITSLRALKKKVACQGLHWPDSDILEANFFNVARVVVFEAMFDMIDKGRCDYFPRGIHEIMPEYKTFGATHANLAIASNLMIRYPAPVYYFLGKHNTELAKRIETGLERLIVSGEFDELIRQNPLTSHVFPLSKWQNVTLFQLTNPELPEININARPELWLNLPNSQSPE